MIQLSEHWKKNLSEISCLPRKPSMLKKTDLLNCEICNGKIFLTAGIMNGSFVPCLPILIWSLGRATNRNSRLRKNRIYKFPVFMLSKKRYYIKKRRRYIQMKAHKTIVTAILIRYTSIWYIFSFVVSLFFNRFFDPARWNCESW